MRKIKLTVDLREDDPSRFALHTRLPKKGAVATVKSVRTSDGYALVKFRGFAWPFSLSPSQFEIFV